MKYTKRLLTLKKRSIMFYGLITELEIMICKYVNLCLLCQEAEQFIIIIIIINVIILKMNCTVVIWVVKKRYRL
jgi:hypothetical protein